MLDNSLINSDPGSRGSFNFGQVVPTRVESYNEIKNAIWVYFILVVFEGALRKWVLPGLSTPLLVVRDPVAMLIIILAWKKKAIPRSAGLIWLMLIGFLSILTAVSIGHGNVLVALYGGRIFLFHLPVMYIIANVFEREDLIKVGRATLILAIPMTILIALQFYSPQSALVNRGVGDDINGAGFNGGALGYFRPPGTFSFTTGNTQFYAIVTVFVFYFLLNPKEINRIVLIAATACLIAAVPFSISRSMFFQIMLTGIFVIIATARKSQYFFKVIFGMIIIAVALYILSQYSFFQTATLVFTSRFDTANSSQNGVSGVLLNFYISNTITTLSYFFSDKVPILGLGVGLGTNVASTLLAGKKGFLISELEWERIIGELGPIMGFIIIFIRLNLTYKIIVGSYKKLATGDSLPWILLSVSILLVAQGGWAQPTSLGFCVISGGLSLASIKKPLLKSGNLKGAVQQSNSIAKSA